jgi:hypothetical protein
LTKKPISSKIQSILSNKELKLIINNAPAQEAVLSNVGEIGEFRIRNSAKAFNILSSGLYANKIRAIIRELSCNAVDSHTAAGKQGTPFDVHLPNTINPTFSIRDYGTGLTHEQVQSIYTTYFESTKTESNAFIGALGLGSKSPFSYTDNFTVTAIKDGKRNVYSAFINGEGVPSIVLMHSEDSTDPNGVEVKFAVDNRNDFYKFEEEARYVYTYFALRPIVSGGVDVFQFRDVEYKDKNIIPGVHYTSSRGSRAVMGNIAYPIDLPNPAQLGDLANLLNCSLEMHFDIGELDFQASREGLSYIPQTVNAIKAKLEAVNAQLAVHLTLEADTITNDWEKSYFLLDKSHDSMWGPAARKYIADTKFDLLTNDRHYVQTAKMEIDVKDLASKYNIEILAFQKGRGAATCYELKPTREYDKTHTSFEQVWNFHPDRGTVFVENDTKVGAYTRAKYHWKNAPQDTIPSKGHSANVYVMQAVDKNKVMDVIGFMAELKNPPANQCVKASVLIQKARKETGAGMGANVSILKLGQRGYGGYHKEREMVWKDAGKADTFDATETYYYLPLRGFEVLSDTDTISISNMRHFHDLVAGSGIPGLHGITIYGVRKSDIEYIKTQKNWVNVQGYIRKVLAKMDPKIVEHCALKQVDLNKYFRYNSNIANLLDSSSPFVMFVEKFRGLEKVEIDRHSLEKLCRDYATPVDMESAIKVVTDELTAIRNRYPLLSSLRDYDINSVAVAQYINLIDKEA